MENTIWEDGLKMFGVEIGVSPTVADDIIFGMETDRVVDISNKLVQILIGATLNKETNDIKVAKEGLEMVKKDFERGVKNGVFNPTDVKKMVEVVNEFIADPLSALTDEGKAELGLLN